MRLRSAANVPKIALQRAPTLENGIWKVNDVSLFRSAVYSGLTIGD